MVDIALAGGTSQVAREVLDALLASPKKHNITILSRGPQSASSTFPSDITWRIVDYNSVASLTAALKGMHTVLSFIQLLSDPDQTAQKNLVNACLAAKVKRFAPSEYGSAGLEHMSWWSGKQVIREYLAKINTPHTRLEYTLFQPGLFLDYLAYPHNTATHLQPLQTTFDFEHRRAMLIEDHDPVMTLTTVRDFAAVVALAVGLPDEVAWPVVGGIAGWKARFSEVVRLGERVRGSPFAIERIQLSDLKAGKLNTSWRLEATHKAVADHDAEAVATMLNQVAISMLLSAAEGAWDVSDELNTIFPAYEFQSPEEFLRKAWVESP